MLNGMLSDVLKAQYGSEAHDLMKRKGQTKVVCSVHCVAQRTLPTAVELKDLFVKCSAGGLADVAKVQSCKHCGIRLLPLSHWLTATAAVSLPLTHCRTV